MPGYKDWIDTIDIRIDYYSAFMKAWISFNEWCDYMRGITIGVKLQ